ncbi:ABC transporter ATP-binding protein [Halorubrum lacusprofundi]|jgi:oligopeptide/dipeptide ABC transporter ATP-binding protein|uniref:Oligopeptide/dipeptide ABC transporter, ATPase subunit n=2 Tax=Halorubrum lacusprofundi TaxID=2247 RepID=B9LWF3_HALLT|nr:ABC transporter ATP-binding protein [Halorubrum lacusprofundi]ACM58794.1 oligopeptide/dipeptide ABC transporter, ATPase subunit [Halorubrum lacusprofundi ATCC 49239]MCG1008033.1 ABC transporter ATP-binding protein [Halorubrum lacusprofundi]
MTAPVLEVKCLKKYFESSGWFSDDPPAKAVDGVSFSIEEGETLALIGESGSGKSTIAKTIIDIHETTDGLIRYQGEDITNPISDQMETIRSDIQLVFQDPTSCLNPRRTIRKTLLVPLKATGVPTENREARVSEMLERVGLTDEYLHKYPHELSGGQKQRVNIARALAVEPKLLILDEPTSALDVSVQAKIINLLDDLQDELDLTYLFITHDLSLVRNFADETAVMYLGKIQEQGPTEEIFESPRHPYTRALLSSIPVTSERDEAYRPESEPLRGEVPSPRDVPSGCRLHPRCPHATDECSMHDPETQSIDDVDITCIAYEDDTDGFDALLDGTNDTPGGSP